MALSVTGVSFRFGESCHINSKDGLQTFWGPLLAVAAASIVTQAITFVPLLRIGFMYGADRLLVALGTAFRFTFAVCCKRNKKQNFPCLMLLVSELCRQHKLCEGSKGLSHYSGEGFSWLL